MFLSDDWERVSIILTPSRIVVAQDFFQWLFTSKEKELQIKCVEKIEKLDSFVWCFCYQTLYLLQSCILRLFIKPGLREQDWSFQEILNLRLKFETEAGVQEMVGCIREAWEMARGVKLEVTFK